MSALISKTENSMPCIVNLGASNHMTGDTSLFMTYKSCSERETVQIVDGSLSMAARKRSMMAIKKKKKSHLRLCSVCAQTLIQFVSVSKLTKDQNCIAKCFSTHCEFQELYSGRMIRNAKKSVGLYLLDTKTSLERQTQLASCNYVHALISHSNKDSVLDPIMLWHFRLGHLSFSYLKHLFPYLFYDKNINVFHCELCKMAKHCQNTYPTKSYEASHPFSIIHSNIWEPSRVLVQNGLSPSLMVTQEPYGFI